MQETLIGKLKTKSLRISRCIRMHFVTKLSQSLFMNKYLMLSDIFFLLCYQLF